MIDLIKPKEFVINEKTYILSRFPAVEGREIACKYPTSAIPKLGDYETNEQTMFKLMSYVCAVINGEKVRLDNRALINNHVEDWETLMKIEAAMIEYNASFFQNGRISSFFEDFAQNVQVWISSTMTNSLHSLFKNDTPVSTN